MSDDRAVERIGKLLAQAEGTDNEHEAEAFVTRAQELATSYAVDLEVARARQTSRRLAATGSGEGAFEQRRLAVGERGRRGNRQQVLLYLVVAQANDVLVNVAQDSTFVLGFGYPADLDVVEQLWVSLATQMAAAAGRRLRAGEHRAAAVPAVSWRLSFYDGWLAAVQARLTQARERALARHDEARAVEGAAEGADGDGADGAADGTAGVAAGTAVSGALVLRHKAERVRAFHDEASQARGSWRGGRGDRQVSRTAWQAGHREGTQARLGEPALAPRRALG